ncbi:MAG TPA: hypothetical protein VFS06_03520 [Casimicrobiaceae bacterium]|nr:hypothetical protein [Casimicrobiaceae bacterium]
MSEDEKTEWLALGEALLALCPEKFREVVRGLRDVIDAQKIIARFDWQLFFRGRPRKKYVA